MATLGEEKTIPGRGEQAVVPLLHHLASSQSLRVLFMLEELNETNGTAYRLQCYDRVRPPRKSDLSKHFPLGKSPIMQVYEHGKLSDKIYQLPKYPGLLTESSLILEWLDETFGAGLFTPETELHVAQDRFFRNFAQATTATKVDFALIWEMVPQELPWGLRQLAGLMVTPVVNYWKTDQAGIFRVMDDALTDEAPWFAGAKMGLSDINMIWGMDVAWQRGYVDRKAYPKLAKWYRNIVTRPAFKRALERGGAYDLYAFRMGTANHPALDPEYKWD